MTQFRPALFNPRLVARRCPIALTPVLHKQILHDWAQTIRDGSIIKKCNKESAIRSAFIQKFFIAEMNGGADFSERAFDWQGAFPQVFSPHSTAVNVIPAQTGIQKKNTPPRSGQSLNDDVQLRGNPSIDWIPACAGMTVGGGVKLNTKLTDMAQAPPPSMKTLAPVGSPIPSLPRLRATLTQPLSQRERVRLPFPPLGERWIEGWGQMNRYASFTLNNWWELDCAAFRAEAKKLFKQDIPLAERNDWESYFNSQRASVENFTAQIAQLEAALNGLVYTLFDLTPDEIALIEQGAEASVGRVTPAIRLPE